MDSPKHVLEEIDADLAQRYGDYAGYETDASPYLVETYGEEPENEVKRLLEQILQPHHKIVDVGCGAGKTLCRFASKVGEVWGMILPVIAPHWNYMPNTTRRIRAYAFRSISGYLCGDGRWYTFIPLQE